LNKTISILGCGWLGLPLARTLIADGYTVRGSTTSAEKVLTLRDAGIDAHKVRLTPALETDHPAAFFSADVLFLNVPPSRDADNPVQWYRRQTEAAVEGALAHGVSWVIFVSATSVYPSNGAPVTESDAKPSSERAETLLAAEEVVRNAASDHTILRYGGLIGGGRHPGRFMAGRSGVSGAESRVNLIHQVDAVGVARAVIHQNVRNDVMNVSAPEHPTRANFYAAAAADAGVEPPSFDPDASRPNKIVDTDRLQQLLDYAFTFPNPMDPYT